MSFPTSYVGKHRAPRRRPAATRSAALLLGVTVAATGALDALPARADPQTPVQLTGIAQYQPSLSSWYNPARATTCLAGGDDCVPVTIDTMSTIFDPLASSCDHRAPFLLAYLRPGRPAIMRRWPVRRRPAGR
jgi:hypothetical protein